MTAGFKATTGCILAFVCTAVAFAADNLPIPDIAAIGNAVAVHLRPSMNCQEQVNEKPALDSDDYLSALLYRNRDPGYYSNAEMSGTIISSDGYLITAAVDRPCPEYIATLPDGSSTFARLIATDSGSSLALLKVERSGFPALGIANLEEVKAGATVVSVSAPRQLHGTVGVGVISTVRRVMPEAGYAGYYVQSSAPIHMGSSGGPLLNDRGELVGIHEAIFTSNGAFQGISFALPADFVARAVADLRSHGHVRRARLGVVMRDSVRDDGSSQLAIDQVEEKSPAHGKLRADDIVHAIDGLPLYDSGGLAAEIHARRPGDQIILQITRDGETMNISIILAEVPSVTTAPDAEEK